MGDLDALLQDFSYLKSLETRDQAPKKLAKKLYLPDPSVRHAIDIIFEASGEAEFDRIFNRPLGRRCFSAFVNSSEYSERHPAAAAVLSLLDEVDHLYSDKPAMALETAQRFLTTRLQQPPAVAELELWKPELFEALDRRLDRLRARATQGGAKSDKVINVKHLFKPFVPAARSYLSEQVWTGFRASAHWVRYCQWKHLELNMNVGADDFDIYRIIGRGGFGEVFPCRKRDTGAVFAMKKLSKRHLKQAHQEASAVHERNVLAEMHSKFVTNLRYAFHDANSLYLVMELMEGGDLSFHLKARENTAAVAAAGGPGGVGGKFTEDEARFYAAEIVMGLAHIHSRNMVYRDLKPANVMLDTNGHARLTDMGLARNLKRSNPTSACGTPGYMAPEVMREGASYDKAADWWSLGVSLYQMVTGTLPFVDQVREKTHSSSSLLGAIETAELRFPPGLLLGDAVQDLIARLLERDPAKRLGSDGGSNKEGGGAHAVRDHAFFADIDWQALVDHKLKPPIVPVHGQVNAKNVGDLGGGGGGGGDSDGTQGIGGSRSGVKLGLDDDRKYYYDFDHIMTHHWQDEILSSMYDAITDRANVQEAKAAKQATAKQSAIEVARFKDSPPRMQGFVLQKKKGLLGGTKKMYAALWTTTLELCPGPMRQATITIDLSSVDDAALEKRKGATSNRNRSGGRGGSSGNKAVVLLTLVDKRKPFRLVLPHASDAEVWLSVLQSAIRAIKVGATDVENVEHPTLRVRSKSVSAGGHADL